jgi:hypothetical protein
MDIVKISKTKLLKELTKNRSEHKEIYELALAGWKEQVIKGLQDALAQAKLDIEYTTFLDIDEPRHHLKEYDEIIDRVQWHEDNIIELNIREFNNFVRDNWDWSYDFLNQAHIYSSSSSSSSSSTMSVLEKKIRSLS